MKNIEFKKRINSILIKKKRNFYVGGKQLNTINFFSKHHNRADYNYITEVGQMKFHWPNKNFYLNKKLTKNSLFLDAGCGGGGVGRSFLKGYERITNYVGVDLGDNLNKVKRNNYLNTFVYKSLIEDVKFKKDAFDVILCHGVLHHIKNYKKSLKKIFKILNKKGILFLTVNKKLPFILNTNTENLKKEISKMPKKKSGLLIKNITEVGRLIRKIDKKVVVNKDLKYIDIPKGTYYIHDLIHYYIFRNFYNLKWPFKASLNHNRDWYYPSVSHNFDLGEIEGFFKKNKVKILKKYNPSPSVKNYILTKI